MSRADLEAPKGDLLPWALAAAGSFFYLSVHSFLYNFDGVACAIAVELGDARNLTHGNHVIYGLVGYWFYRLWQFFGYHGRALICLQALDSLAGGLGLGVFYVLARRWGLSRRASALATAGLAVSWAYWLWSLEAQVYLLGAFFLLLAAAELSRDAPRPAVSGLWHGLAILGHVGHVMFMPVVFYLLKGEKGWPVRSALRHLLAASFVVAGTYGLAVLLCVRPHSLDDLRIWFLGSATLTPDRSFKWHGSYSWESLKQWVLATLRIFSDARALDGWTRSAAWLIGAGSLVAALSSVRFHAQRRRQIVAGFLWLGCYFVLYSSWEPQTLVYRVTDLIALWLLIGLSLGKSNRLAAALAAGILLLGGFNAFFQIRRVCDPASNPEYISALRAAAVVPEDGWILTTGMDQVYVPYFARRRNVYWMMEGGAPSLRTRRRLDQIESEKAVLFVPAESLRTLEEVGWLARYCGWTRTPKGRGEFYECAPAKRRKGIPGAEGKKS